jgi:E3 ubiquitin-protein ligase HUWE1
VLDYRINAFLEGFYDIIPKRLISIFNEQELELLISGLPNVDIEDLRANTEYHKYQPTSLQVRVNIWTQNIIKKLKKIIL